jgi:hypothetical protein
MNVSIKTVVAACIAFTLGVSIACEARAFADTITPVPEVQAQIQRAAQAISEWNHEAADQEGLIQAFKELDKLKEIDSAVLVVQIVYALAHLPTSEAIKVQGMTGLLREYCRISDDDWLIGLVDHVGSDNKMERRWMHYAFEGMRPPMRRLNCAIFQPYFQDRPKDWTPPVPLVECMYLEDASSALMTLLRTIDVGVNGPTLLALHHIDDLIWMRDNGFEDEVTKALPGVKADLQKIADDKRWWVRVYVPAIMRQLEWIVDKDLIAKLLKDENESVRGFAEARKSE